uniref:(northern house mosquito) hypothetical protein n=2 Tax=Culex pipiens TaxID=7175 RepID=A0A8D8DMI9_CULPI
MAFTDLTVDNNRAIFIHNSENFFDQQLSQFDTGLLFCSFFFLVQPFWNLMKRSTLDHRKVTGDSQQQQPRRCPTTTDKAALNIALSSRQVCCASTAASLSRVVVVESGMDTLVYLLVTMPLS